MVQIEGPTEQWSGSHSATIGSTIATLAKPRARSKGDWYPTLEAAVEYRRSSFACGTGAAEPSINQAV